MPGLFTRVGNIWYRVAELAARGKRKLATHWGLGFDLKAVTVDIQNWIILDPYPITGKYIVKVLNDQWVSAAIFSGDDGLQVGQKKGREATCNHIYLEM